MLNILVAVVDFALGMYNMIKRETRVMLERVWLSHLTGVGLAY